MSLPGQRSGHLIRSTLVSGLDALVLLILVVAATPILITSLGSAGYGAFVFLGMFSAYGALYLLEFGVEGALTTVVARFDATGGTEEIADAVRTSILFYMLVGLLAGALVWIGGEVITRLLNDNTGGLDQNDLLQAIHFTAFSLPFQFLSIPFIAVLQGLGRFTITKSVNIVTNVVQYGAIVTVAVIYSTVSALMLVVLAVAALKACSYIIYTFVRKRNWWTGSWKIKRETLSNLTGYGSTLLLARLIEIVNRNIDRFLTGLYLPVTSLTIYDVIFRPQSLLRMPGIIIGTTTLPESARKSASDQTNELGQFYEQLVRYTYLLLIPGAVFIGAMASPLLAVWVGEQFTQQAWMLWLVVAAMLPTPLTLTAYNIAVGQEQARKIIWIPTAAMLINLILSLVLVRSFGLPGLLWATVAAQFFMVAPYLGHLRRNSAVNWQRCLAKVGLIIVFNLPHALILFWLAKNQHFNSPLTSLLVAGLITLFSTTVELHFLLDQNERKKVTQFLHRLIGR